MAACVKALTIKNKELIKFKCKLELERENHEKTKQEMETNKKANTSLKGFKEQIDLLRREKKHLIDKVENLKEEVRLSNSKSQSSHTNTTFLEEEIQRLQAENCDLHEVCAMHTWEKHELKKVHEAFQAQNSKDMRNLEKSPVATVTTQSTLPDASPISAPRVCTLQNEKENCKQCQRGLGNESIPPVDCGGRKSRKRKMSKDIDCEPGSNGYLKSDDQCTPVTKRHQWNEKCRISGDLDPTLPCTFSESLDLTQESEPNSVHTIPTQGQHPQDTGSRILSDDTCPASPCTRQPVCLQEVHGLTVLGRNCLCASKSNAGMGVGFLAGSKNPKWNIPTDSNQGVEIRTSDCKGNMLNDSQGSVQMNPSLERENNPQAVSKNHDADQTVGFKYQEVVRKQADRQLLPGFNCSDCKAFYDALISWGNVHSPVCGHAVKIGKWHSFLHFLVRNGFGDLVDFHEPPLVAAFENLVLVDALDAGGHSMTNNAKSSKDLCQDVSRHRARHRIPLSPEGFWDMDFPGSTDGHKP